MGILVTTALVCFFVSDARYYKLPYTTATIREKKHKLIWTIDDHPNKQTPKILSILKKARIKATFFVNTYLISNSKKYPKDWRLKRVVNYYKKIKKAGHVIGNHSHTHSELCRLSKRRVRWELIMPQILLKKMLGAAPLYWRPPNGTVCKRSKREAKRLKLKRVMWDIGDYKVSSGRMWSQLLWRVRRGKKSSVLLFHKDTKKLNSIIRRVKKGK